MSVVRTKRLISGTREWAGQTDKAVRRVHQILNRCKVIRWKESYKKVLGLELADQPGLDR